MATIRDIAKEAGVSVGTASRAITGNGYVSEGNRTLVQKAMDKLGYTPKEHTRPAKSAKAIGIVLPDVTFPFYGSYLKYTEFELARRGYKTVICNTLGVQNRVSSILDQLEQGELDGMIINADVAEEEIARMEKLPVVSFERMLSKKIPMVSSDHRQGGQMAAKALAESGCKNVLILTAKHSNQLFGECRITECQCKLQEQGVKATIVEYPSAMSTYSFVKEMASEYLRLYSDVDGIFSDDVMAFCCSSEALKRGIRVPEELKIVGYDGVEITKIVVPSITTIVQDVPRLTQHSVDLLMRRIGGEQTEDEILLPVTFLQGGTT